VFCKRQPDGQVNIWGFAIKTGNLPWVLLFMSLITGSDMIKILTGYAIGHLYEFLKTILPETYGYDLLFTPNWFKRIFSWVAGQILSYTNPPQRQMNNVRNMNEDPGQQFNNAGAFAAFRGRGVRIGGE
jgi:hypothetical protein